MTKESVMMDATTTTFGKQNGITISRNLSVFLVLLFLCCLVGTGLLGYHFSSSPERYIYICNYSLPVEVTTTEIKEESSSTEVTTVATVIVERQRNKTEKLNLRLPKTVIPHSYELKLIPFILEGNFTFHGEVIILINATEETDSIYLHALDLFIDETSLLVMDQFNNTIDVLELTNEPEKHFIIFKLARNLETDHQYYLRIRYAGILNDLLQGFYRSSYKDRNETRWIAATQFQPTDARRAFPCFDEPALKAKFKLSLARNKNMSSISNMPQIGEPEPLMDLEDYVWDHYEETVPMSTYLLAFIVSDFGYIRNGSFSVWARKNAISQTEFALQVGVKILAYYEDFFNIDYPLPKIDMIALPDFAAGAMENWGILTYRESVILYDPEISSRGNSQRIAMVIAHELAHQWFGNLVTPIWWTDLWLNEGFATYLEYIGANIVDPTWKMLDQFLINEVQSTFQMDALKSSHQISVEVNNPDEVNDIFDKISYSKGAAVIRMMENFLTPQVFRAGIFNFLNERKYGNAEQDDLWATLTQVAHRSGVLDHTVTVKEIMDSWTLQVGFPVLTVLRNYENNSATIIQERFLAEQSLYNKINETLWWIPISYTDERGYTKYVWMKPEKQLSLYDLTATSSNWLLVNINQTGYYRVNYDINNWKLISEEMRSKNGHLKFDIKNRAQILDDAFNLAATGYIHYDIVLNISMYLIQEREYIPWSAAFTNLDYLYDMFVRSGHFDKFKVYMVKLIDGIYNTVGFKDVKTDPQLVVYTRIYVVRRACKLGVLDCVINAVGQFQNWRHSPDPDKHNPISPNLRAIVYCTAVANGGQEEWDFIWKRYLNANVGTEKEILMSALGCSREIWLLSRYLEWAITENSGIRKQDSARVFAAVASNVVGRELSYRFFKNNWNRLKAYTGSSSMILNQIARACTSQLNTREEVDDLIRFAADKNEFGVALRAIQQSIEQGEANIQWMKRNYDQIVQWLSNMV